jgi:acyl-coenzyme A thioesterase PaaI-like protein
MHLNPWGTVHGGLAATLLDSCMGLAIQSTLEKGVGSTTLEFKISLLRPITPETGQITAEGVCDEPRSPRWHRRRSDHRQQAPLARPWHNHMSDLSKMMVL